MFYKKDERMVETFVLISILISVFLFINLLIGCSAPYRIGDKKNDGFCWTKEAYKLSQEQLNYDLEKTKAELEFYKNLEIEYKRQLEKSNNMVKIIGEDLLKSQEKKCTCPEINKYFKNKTTTKQTKEFFYYVEKNDWLSKIAEHYWNNYKLWPIIFWDNTEIKDYNLIYIGQELKIKYNDSLKEKALEFHEQKFNK